MSAADRNRKLYIASQFLYAMVFTIPIWIVYYKARITISQISLLVALQYSIQLLCELPTGAIADLFGRKWSVALGYLGWVIASIMILLAHGFPMLILATIFGGLAESLISGALEALVYDSYKEEGREKEFSKALATNGIYFQFGLAIGTVGGGLLYQIWTGLPYLLYAGCCFLAAILALLFIEPKQEHQPITLKRYKNQMRDGFREIFKNRTVTLISLFYVTVAGITWTNNLYFFDFMLVDLGFTGPERGVIGAIIRIFNVTVLRALLNNEKLFTRERSILFFPIVMLICFLPGIFFQGVLALLFVAGSVMTGTARWIVLAKYTNEGFESKYRATAISSLSMLVGLVYVIITFSSGFIMEHFGGVRTMYTVLGIITAVTVLPISLFLIKHERKML